MRELLTSLCVLITMSLGAQYSTSYHVGSPTDLVTEPHGGIVLMGGATENDNAMRWFLERADGGDIVVIRTSGNDGYNAYLYQQLGVSVNSVETIVFHDPRAAWDTDVIVSIEKAEAIWIAGGDQSEYIDYWRDTPVVGVITDRVRRQNLVVGGTSAGMALLGSHYFTAQNGTIRSDDALANPYDDRITLSDHPFVQLPWLEDVITDTHYDNPDRRGRHMTFMARWLTDERVALKGLASEEFTAICIDTLGYARVFGSQPEYDDNAHFLQIGCPPADSPIGPERCVEGQSLHWVQDEKAVHDYKIPGYPDGRYGLDLNDWLSGQGGEWLHWYVSNGELQSEPGDFPECLSTSTPDLRESAVLLYPNPVQSTMHIDGSENFTRLQIRAPDGKLLLDQDCPAELEVQDLPAGLYHVILFHREGHRLHRSMTVW